MSGSKYGVLEAWGLERAGAPVPAPYWQAEDAAWKKAQKSGGGWDYHAGAATQPATTGPTSKPFANAKGFYTYDPKTAAGPQTRPATLPVASPP